jgi:hypothetical protein
MQMLKGLELEKEIINKKMQRSATIWCKYIFPKQLRFHTSYRPEYAFISDRK